MWLVVLVHLLVPLTLHVGPGPRRRLLPGLIPLSALEPADALQGQLLVVSVNLAAVGLSRRRRGRAFRRRELRSMQRQDVLEGGHQLLRVLDAAGLVGL